MANLFKSLSTKRIFGIWIWFFIVLLLLIGIATSILVYVNNPQDIFKSLGLLVCVIWVCIFLGYFCWAVNYYNINQGFTDDQKKKIEEASRAGNGDNPQVNQGNVVYNPYRSQTFGFPPGTVRGMIAFTLLFVAIALMIVSMGMDSNTTEPSFIRDNFEFIKTAFLMMIAFYFGNHSLKYLQKRWPNTLQKDSKKTTTSSSDELSGNMDDVELENQLLDEENQTFDATNKPMTGTIKPNTITELKRAIASSEKEAAPAKSEGEGLIPIIDAGHGGMVNGNYTTAPSKMYEFEDDGLTVYEGVINRKIGKKLIDFLDGDGIPYHDLTVHTNNDVPLRERTDSANALYSKNKKYYFLSIHSNTASAKGVGKGTNANGFEIWTSVGQTKSDTLADIASRIYKSEFPEFRFRQDMTDDDPDKESQFWVLRKTACPAFLVENLFYDNRKEAEFLLSDKGQERIAKCLYKVVKEIYHST